MRDCDSSSSSDTVTVICSWSRGNKIRFREYSFLKNPKTKKHVRDSVHTFKICQVRKVSIYGNEMSGFCSFGVLD